MPHSPRVPRPSGGKKRVFSAGGERGVTYNGDGTFFSLTQQSTSCQPLCTLRGRAKRDTSFLPPRCIRHRRRFGGRPPDCCSRIALGNSELVFKSHCEYQKIKDARRASFIFWCERWDLNPHVYSDTSTSSLPVCRFQHARLSLTDLTIIPNPDHLSSGRGGFPYQTLLVFFQMPMRSACLMRSSRKEGWAMLMSSSARSQVVLPFRSAAPYSVTT